MSRIAGPDELEEQLEPVAPLDPEAVLAALDAQVRPGGGAVDLSASDRAAREGASTLVPRRVRADGAGPRRIVLAWVAVLVGVVAVAMAGRLPAAPSAALLSPSAAVSGSTDGTEASPGASTQVTADTRIPIVGIDLPLGADRYAQTRVIATMRVFGQVRGPDPGAMVVEVADGAGDVIGMGRGSTSTSGRFDIPVRYAPPVDDRHVTVSVRSAATGATLAAMPYIAPARGPVAIWSPTRLEGWRRGDRVDVLALVLEPTGGVHVRLVEDSGRVLAETDVSSVPMHGAWDRVDATLVVPPTAARGRLWLEVEAPWAGDREETARARILLDIRG